MKESAIGFLLTIATINSIVGISNWKNEKRTKTRKFVFYGYSIAAMLLCVFVYYRLIYHGCI